MRGHQLRRLATVVSTALLGVMLLGVSTASAGQPGWTFTSIDTSANPDTVGTGYNADYVTTLDNPGPSNISALYLSTDIPTKLSIAHPSHIFAPQWFSDVTGLQIASQPYTCNATGPLNCSLGTLNADVHVTIEVIFVAAAPGTNYGSPSPASCAPGTSTTAYTFHFTAFGNGNTPTDKGGKSHGDTLCGKTSVTTSSSPDFAGGFTLDDSFFGTTGTVGTNNKQTTTLFPPAGTSFIAATVEDGLPDTAFTCDIAACANRFGEWSKIDVNGGHPYNGGFEIQLLVFGGAVPGPAKTTNINLIHNDGTTTYVISLRCDGTTTLDAVAGGHECITVKTSGKNFLITAYLNHNGGARGTF